MKKKNEQAPVAKNDELVLTITDMSEEGNGIGRTEGYALFVKDTVPGDTVKVKVMKTKKNFGFARLVELLTPSPDRVEPVCPVAASCGGCQIMHCDYERQLSWKEEKVANCLRRIGGVFVMTEKEAEKFSGKTDGQKEGEKNSGKIEDQKNVYFDSMEGKPVIMEPIMGMDEPYYYRNKAQFPVGYDSNHCVVTGFYAGRTHSIIPTDKCYIQAKENEEILKTICGFLQEENISLYDEKSHTGLVRHILTRKGFATGEIMVWLVINGDKLPSAQKLVNRLKTFAGMKSIGININKQKTNKILGEKCVTLWGEDYITDYIGSIRYQISPLSFYQVNPVQTEKLYGKALEYAALEGQENVWDLYCGIGTISLFLAQRAKKVYGVEIVPQAIADARQNARLNDISNVEFFVGKAEEVLPQQYEENGIYADVIVVDPPRKGCDSVALETMLRMAPKRIVYVSCDPATLARDVKILVEGGYELKKVSTTDMFPHSGHVETIVALHRTDM